MEDTARHGALQPANDGLRHTLSVNDVAAQLLAAGVPRSRRHIVRLCKSGLFDAKKLPGGSGDEYFIAPESVPKAIGDLRAMQENRERRSAPQRATSDRVVVETAQQIETDGAGHGTPQPAMSEKETSQKGSETEPATARYVALLERDNEFLREQVTKKDEQITDLSKRFGETQTLLGAMQRMLAPLLGQADPFIHPEKREVTGAEIS